MLRFDYEDFDRMLEELIKLRDNPEEDERMVNSSTFWLIADDRKLVGAVNIGHRLNKYLLEIGGHIGYGIRPSERRKGYATELLRQALKIIEGYGITKVRVTCDKDNIGSAKTIIKNGGIMESEAIIDGVEIQRYWIDLTRTSVYSKV